MSNCGWQFVLVGLAFVAALVLLVYSCHRVPQKRNAFRINPMFSRDWKDKL